MGLDRCGKSTVAQALSELLPSWYRYHNTRPCIDPFLHFSRFLTSARLNGIVDRLHWCEIAYGNAWRGKTDMTDRQFKIIELMCMTQNVKVIYMYDSLENIKSRWSDDEMYDFGIMADVAKWYDVAIAKSRLHVSAFRLPDLVQDGKPTTALREMAEIERYQAEQVDDMSPSLGYGSKYGFVIVGDSPNNELVPSGGVFAPWIYGDSSDYLWHAIESNDIEWERGFYTNASSYGFDGEKFNYHMKRVVQPGKIVALGNVAKKLCEDAKLPYEQSVHPAFLKRFRNGSKDVFAANMRPLLSEYIRQGSTAPESQPGEGNHEPNA
jgi:hypothetical protein